MANRIDVIISDRMEFENSLSKKLGDNPNKKDAIYFLKHACLTALKMEGKPRYRKTLKTQDGTIETLCEFIAMFR